MHPIAVGILAGITITAILAFIVFRPKKRQIDILGDLVAVDEVRAKVFGKPDDAQSTGVRFATNFPKLFAGLVKITGINLNKIEEKILRAGSKSVTAYDVAFMQSVALVGGGGFVLLLLILHGPLIMAGLVLALGLALYIAPVARLDGEIQRREQNFVREFPAFLDALAIPLSQGTPPLRVLERVAERYPGIVGEEFSRVVLEARAQGDRIAQPLEDLTNRIRIPMVSDFVSAFSVSRGSGSELGPVVRKMSNTIRIQSTQTQEAANKSKMNSVMLVVALTHIVPFFVVILAPILMHMASTFGAMAG